MRSCRPRSFVANQSRCSPQSENGRSEPRHVTCKELTGIIYRNNVTQTAQPQSRGSAVADYGVGQFSFSSLPSTASRTAVPLSIPPAVLQFPPAAVLI